MLIDTQFVIRLNFVLNNNHAIFLLASYLEAKEDLPSVTKHVPFLVEFMLWHKLKNLQSITQETTSTYIKHLYSTKTKSYADVIRSYLRSFCTYLLDNGYGEEISFDNRPKGKEEDPLKPHKVFNYYKYLGVPKTADLDTIKKAYHNKVRLLHPDLNQDDPKATDKVTSLNKVYSVLKNNLDKLAYDVTMGFVEYEDYMDNMDDIVWHDKKYYFIWV